MTKKKTETAIGPGESADIGTHVITNTSEHTAYVQVEAEPVLTTEERFAHLNVEYVPGGQDIAAQNAEAMRYVPRVENGPLSSNDQKHDVEFVETDMDMNSYLMRNRLEQTVSDLVLMQHARAAADGGTATHWQNAQTHIKRAIECIERQAVDDAEMAKTPASDLPST